LYIYALFGIITTIKNTNPPHSKLQKMTKKILFATLTAVWLTALSVSIKNNPKLGNMLCYSTSALQFVGAKPTHHTLTNAPYGKATLGYDHLGIPHIFATTEEAAAYTIGYAQAHDRLFQLEMIARTVQGRLCEIVGKKAIKRDLFWRKFDIERAAKAHILQLQTQNPAEFLKYQAFADGVNDYIHTMPYSQLPIEFHLLDARPSKFKPENMYYLIRYMSHTLTYDEDDLAFEQLSTQLPDTLLNFYYPTISTHALPIHPKLDTTLRPTPITPNGATIPNPNNPFAQKIKTNPTKHQHIAASYRPQRKNTDLGSNNWCIGNAKSVGGYPILCNDTHLSLKLPATWYEMHISVNGATRHGFGLAGSPYIISGYNDNVAWGMTNATWNLVDFYDLQLTDNNQSYIINGKPQKFGTHTDTIYIRGAKPLYKTYYHSPFGVMDSIGGAWLAINWIGEHVKTGSEGACFAAFERAQTAQEAFLGVQGFVQPAQNFVIADRLGNFGIVTAGAAALHKQPVRGIIHPKTTNDLVVYNKMAGVLNTVNPKSGFVFSANGNQTTQPLSAQMNAINYAPSYRAKRIAQFIDNKEKLTETDMQRLHTDQIDMEWLLIKDNLLKNISKNDAVFLENWDGNCTVNSVAATQYTFYKNALMQALNQNIAPQLAIWVQAEHALSLMQQYKILPTTNAQKPIIVDDLIKKAWADSKISLIKEMGNDPKKWQYKNLHRTHIQHAAGIDALGYPAFGSGGNSNTVNVSSGYEGEHGPSMRTIIALKPNGTEATMLLTGGQSGRHNSPNYSDQITQWANGKYHTTRRATKFILNDYVASVSFE
jgi:penicillin amidase